MSLTSCCNQSLSRQQLKNVVPFALLGRSTDVDSYLSSSNGFQCETGLGGPSFDFSVSARLDDQTKALANLPISRAVKNGESSPLGSGQSNTLAYPQIGNAMRRGLCIASSADQRDGMSPEKIVAESIVGANSENIENKDVAAKTNAKTKRKCFFIGLGFLIVLILAAVGSATFCMLKSCNGSRSKNLSVKWSKELQLHSVSPMGSPVASVGGPTDTPTSP